MHKKKYFILTLGVLLIVLFDQLTKIIVVNNLALGESKPVIEGVFEFQYLENTGMAWGMLSNQTWLLAIFSIVLMAGLIYVYHNIIGSRYYLPLRILIGCIIGGAIGNLIDRIRLGYVVDFLYFKLINFPIFNVADIFVTVSVILILILLIFKYKWKDLDVLLGDKIRLEDGSYVEKKTGKSEKTEKAKDAVTAEDTDNDR